MQTKRKEFATGLKRYEYADVKNFTSDIGLKVRKAVNPIWRRILKLGTSRKVIVEAYPKLERKKPYIFVANHSFDEDVISILQTIDRNAYLLQGTTDQMEHNPVFWALWLNGMIYVNRMDRESRRVSIDKMKRVLNAGNSVALFPEGGYNNTENQLMMPLFSSPYILSKELGLEVVPIIIFNDIGSNMIYIRAGEPMNLAIYEQYEAMRILRDKMATIIWNIMEEHTIPQKRAELGEHPRRTYMEVRKEVYNCQKWYRDVWEEELTCYSGHGVTTSLQARSFVDDVKVTSKNAAIFSDVLVRREEDKKYDLKEYLRRNIKLT